MRKILLITFAIALLTITAFSQRKQTDLEFERLKGKVKSVQDSSLYPGTKAKPVKSPERYYYAIESYGLDGNITEKFDPKLGIKYVYQFVDGFLSMKEEVVDKQKAANIMRVESIGKAEDMEKPVKTLKPDERFITRFDDEYDDKGNRKLRRIFFSDGQMNAIIFFSYNSAGLLEKYISNSFGNKWTHFYSYDTDGNRTKDVMKRSDVKDVVDMTDRTEYSGYKFDAEGNWIERKSITYSKSGNAVTVSEAIDYRDIKYYGADNPKQKASGKVK